MNHVYRLVWDASKRMLVAVSEIAGAFGKSGSPQLGGGVVIGSLAALSLALSSGGAWALPTGGQVVAGQAQLSQSGNTLNVQQSSANAILNWQSFGIGANETVNFLQPGASSVALNRVIGADASNILGHLNANGQVFLLNPNGITFAAGAQVNTAGLVASTLNLSNPDFLAGNYRFSGDSTASVVNQGQLQSPNGYIALIANKVDNQGRINTDGGSTVLGAGSSVEMTLSGNQLLSFQVSGSALNALAQNGGVIQADGGYVLLSAQAKDALLQTVVNNSGSIRARSIEQHEGVIKLLGGDAGTTQVSGTLDASAPSSGNGGFIETSGQHLKIADGTQISTKAANGQDGQWLIDPNDFTIAASGGSITGAALTTALNNNSVTIQTTSTTASCAGVSGCTTGTAGNGDINVNDTISWTKNVLTLNAYRNINVNTAMNGSGTAGLALKYGQGATNGVISGSAATVNINAPINLASTGSFNTQLGSSGAVQTYTIITSLGAAGSTTGTDLQGMAGNLSRNYVLGANIDASATSSWNSGAGFTPVGTYGNVFTGILDGLGHTVSNLSINRGSTSFNGLVGWNQGTIRNIGMTGGSVTGSGSTGSLVGWNQGTINNAFATGTVTGGGSNIGGLVGKNNAGTISNAYASGAVTGTSVVGGLVGGNTNSAVISNAYATGAVKGAYAGGLLGGGSGTISNVYATGAVLGGSNAGGLIGTLSSGTLNNAYATGAVSGANYVGGLVGRTYAGVQISNVYATSAVSAGGSYIGGLVGFNSGTISNAYAVGAVSGYSIIGGLVGINYYGTISSAYATGAVKGGSNKGALFGSNANSTVSNAYWDTQTAGLAVGVGRGTAAGAGLTTAQLAAAALPTGFSNTVWGNGASLNTPYLLANSSFGTVSGAVILASDSSATPTVYGLILSLNQLQNIGSTGLAGNYVLGANLDASVTSTWNGGAGFAPIAAYNSAGFSGIFEGLNRTISNLTIKQSSAPMASLFGKNSGTIRNIGLLGGSITGQNTNTAALVGSNSGTIRNAYSTATVSGGYTTGGLVGKNTGLISASYSTGSVTANSPRAGGLVGYNSGTINSNSYATGTVSSSSGQSGGLVGSNAGTISNAGASGTVIASQGTNGGLVGRNSGTITSSYAQGTLSITGYSGNQGGLVGFMSGGTIANSYATGALTVSASVSPNQLGGLVGFLQGGTVSGSYASGSVGSSLSGAVGGLVGQSSNASILSSYATGAVTGSRLVGGLVGKTTSNRILNSYASGAVLGYNSNIGGLIGSNNGSTVSGAYAKGAVSATASSSANIGGLIGFNSGNGSVDSSYATGNVTSSGNGNAVGGLLGYLSSGTLSNDYATGNVLNTGTGTGGLVGAMYGGSLGNAYASGSVSAGGSNVGGLVGNLAAGAGISSAYATGNVTGKTAVGGLIGRSTAPVSNVYALGNVSALQNRAGGLIGSNGAPLSNAYATGRVSAGSAYGALAGSSSSSISNAWWDSTTDTIAGISAVGGSSGGGASVSNVGSLTTAQLAAALPGGFSNTVWANGGNLTTPYLLAHANLGSVSGAVYLGSDTSATPTAYGVIQTLNQLQNISTTGLSGKYLLGTNLDASATSTWNNGAGFAPLASIYTPFTGVFDGLGHTISNLRINRVGSNNVGLFSANNGLIRNLGLVDGSVTGAYLTGALVGMNSGTISNAYATSTVTGGSFTGGLVGANSNGGLMDNVHASGAVTGTGQVGGLAGVNASGSTLRNAYATGMVSGTYTVGGLVGYNSAVMTNTHASGDVSGVGTVGGLAGANYGYDGISNSYATGSVSAANYAGGLIGYNAAPLNTVYASGSVSGTSWIGGLVGYNDASYYGNGSITKAYSSGAVSGSGTAIGGLLGYNSNGSISQVYATGRVSGTGSSMGGLIGSDSTGTISSAYWDTQTTGQSDSAGGGVGLTHAQMLQASSFAGFDFNNTWFSYSGHTAPLLRSYLKPLTVTADNQTQTYSGAGSTLGLLNPVYSVAGAETSGHVLGLDTPYSDAVHASSTAYLPGLWSDQQGYLITVNGGALTITPKAITLGGTRVYDAGTAVAGAQLSASPGALIGSDTLTITGTAVLAGKNAGTQAISDGSGLSLSNGGYSDYVLASSAGSVLITPATLTLSNLSAGNKVYDATTSAAATASLSGVLGSDSVSNTLTASFADKNVGQNKTVTVDAISLSGTDAGNYVIDKGQTTTASITPATLTLSNLSASDKVYDAKTGAAATASLSGVLESDEVSNTLTASFADKNVGQNKTVTVDAVALSGTDAGNYVIDKGQTTTASITPATLTLSNLSASDKVYDAKTSASVAMDLGGVLESDVVSSMLTASFADKNVGQNKAVTVSSAALSGMDAGNYVLASNPIGQSTTASITPATLTLSNLAASDKVYDARTGATATAALNGILDSDAVSSALTASFADKNVGQNKTVTVTGASLSGTDAGNYVLASNSTGQTTTASITPATLTLSNLSASNKVYDAKTGAAATASLSGVLESDEVSNMLTASFADKNVGQNKTVTVDAVALSGGDAGNYVIDKGQTTTASITPATLTLSNLAASDKVYDAKTSASVAMDLGGVLESDVVSSMLTASFADKNVGQNKTVTVSSAMLSGADAGNYVLASNPIGQSTTASITPATLTLGNLSASDKVYDGKTGATATATLSGVLGSDVVRNKLTASFANRNVGQDKTVTINKVRLFGLDARNYVIASGQTTTADITPATLTLSAVSDSKTYDGTRSSSGTVLVQGLKGTDQLVNLRQIFDSRNVLGTNGSTLSVAGSYLLRDGNQGNNYVVVTNTASGTITPAMLMLSAVSDSKTYDATYQSSATAEVSGLLSNDRVLGLTQAFESRNVLGTNGSTLLVSHYNVADGNGGRNYKVLTQTASGTITPAMLTLSAVSDSKTYDGTTTSSAAVKVDGLLGNNQLRDLSQSFTAADPMGTNGSTLQVDKRYQLIDGNQGRNYVVQTQDASGTIEPASSSDPVN